jgi:plasmid stabilization system protein ParE
VVTWSDHAKSDLRHIHDFIATDSRHYAKKVTQDIVDKTLRLLELAWSKNSSAAENFQGFQHA